jgi:hypothetical protein
MAGFHLLDSSLEAFTLEVVSVALSGVSDSLIVLNSNLFEEVFDALSDCKKFVALDLFSLLFTILDHRSTLTPHFKSLGKRKPLNFLSQLGGQSSNFILVSLYPHENFDVFEPNSAVATLIVITVHVQRSSSAVVLLSFHLKLVLEFMVRLVGEGSLQTFLMGFLSSCVLLFTNSWCRSDIGSCFCLLVIQLKSFNSPDNTVSLKLEVAQRLAERNFVAIDIIGVLYRQIKN